EPPREHIRVHEVPEAPVAHLRPGLRARDDEPLRRQHLDRLAHDSTAHARPRRRLDLGRKGVARLQLAPHDLHAQCVDELPVKTAPGMRPFFYHTITIYLATLVTTCYGRRRYVVPASEKEGISWSSKISMRKRRRG